MSRSGVEDEPVLQLTTREYLHSSIYYLPLTAAQVVAPIYIPMIDAQLK